MKLLFDKRFEKRIGGSYSLQSDHPRTVRLAALGFIPLMMLGLSSFAAFAILGTHTGLFIAGFVGSIAAAICWTFYALSYGKRHFEKTARPKRDVRGPR